VPSVPPCSAAKGWRASVWRGPGPATPRLGRLAVRELQSTRQRIGWRETAADQRLRADTDAEQAGTEHRQRTEWHQ
jgi:hypothetical protein